MFDSLNFRAYAQHLAARTRKTVAGGRPAGLPMGAERPVSGDRWMMQKSGFPLVIVDDTRGRMLVAERPQPDGSSPWQRVLVRHVDDFVTVPAHPPA